MNNKGQFLLLALCVLSLLFLTAIPLSRNVLVNIKDQKIFAGKDKAFYLARAGIDKVDWRVNNEGWQGSHSGLNLNDNEIKDLLSNGSGILEFLGDGGFKYIKIIGKNETYIMGFYGKDPNHAKSKIFIKEINKKWQTF